MDTVIVVLVVMLTVRLIAFTGRKSLRGNSYKRMRRSYDAWNRSRKMRYS